VEGRWFVKGRKASMKETVEAPQSMYDGLGLTGSMFYNAIILAIKEKDK
jgi:hypothetical protein